MNIKSLFIVILTTLTSAFAEEKPFPIIYANEIKGLDSVSTDYFDKDALFGYIDGGAELYLEYGFEKVAAQEFKVADEIIKADIYKMNSEYAAYGIFSVSVFNCKETNKIFKYDCVTPMQVLGIAANYFIMITNNSGSEKAKEMSAKIAEKLKEKIPDSPDRNKLIDNAAKNGFTCKFLAGKLAVQNACPDLSEYFADIQQFELFYLKHEEEKNYLNACMIQFKSEDDQNRFIKNCGMGKVEFDENKNAELIINGVYKKINISKMYFAFIESNFPKERVMELLK